DEEDEDWESDDLKEDDESSAGDGFDDDAELENDPSRN
ncbi:MAG TPA: segregation and condensation protein B, partial [Verrucomicrobiales bacterium]|nr:segregation and condensation protein B [Verrucomicrobiales bacterium]HBP55321.1 segregation and condensation protein B [Verrucomicrobiales bacterium]HCP38239.1 segregation and condensation protein B [Verrucomicrobiales bacterium]HCZ01891.1 segregation and condensation protein B [Verrucomicrobiales bacterium]